MFDNAVGYRWKEEEERAGRERGKRISFWGEEGVRRRRNGRLNKIALANMPPPNPKPAFTIALEMAKSV